MKSLEYPLPHSITNCATVIRTTVDIDNQDKGNSFLYGEKNCKKIANKKAVHYSHREYLK